MSKLFPDWQRGGLLEAVFDQLPDALLLYDTHMVITGVNSAAEKMFGMSADKMVGQLHS